MQFPTTSLLLLATTMATTALSSPLSLFSRQASSGPFLVDAVTTSGATLPNTFYPALSYVYSTNTIYTGNIKYHPASEPLRLQGGTASGGFSFLSYHSSPTGYVRMYAFESGTNDLGLTVPHSGAVPAGARIDGWAISEEGGKIT